MPGADDDECFSRACCRCLADILLGRPASWRAVENDQAAEDDERTNAAPHLAEEKIRLWIIRKKKKELAAEAVDVKWKVFVANEDGIFSKDENENLLWFQS